MLPCMQELTSGSSAADAADAEALIGAPQPEEPTQDGELIPGEHPPQRGGWWTPTADWCTPGYSPDIGGCHDVHRLA